MKKLVLLTALSIHVTSFSLPTLNLQKVSCSLGMATGLFYFTESVASLGGWHSLRDLKKQLNSESTLSMSALETSLEHKEKRNVFSAMTMVVSAYLFKMCYDKYPTI